MKHWCETSFKKYWKGVFQATVYLILILGCKCALCYRYSRVLFPKVPWLSFFASELLACRCSEPTSFSHGKTAFCAIPTFHILSPICLSMLTTLLSSFHYSEVWCLNFLHKMINYCTLISVITVLKMLYLGWLWFWHLATALVHWKHKWSESQSMEKARCGSLWSWGPWAPFATHKSAASRVCCCVEGPPEQHLAACSLPATPCWQTCIPQRSWDSKVECVGICWDTLPNVASKLNRHTVRRPEQSDTDQNETQHDTTRHANYCDQKGDYICSPSQTADALWQERPHAIALVAIVSGVGISLGQALVAQIISDQWAVC